MPETHTPERRKLIDYIRSLAPLPAVEEGLLRAARGSVLECSRSGALIQGVVRDEDETHQSVRLEVLSSRSLEVECTCGQAADDATTTWCWHAVALLWRAYELGFFSPDSGFSARESTYRPTVASPSDISAVIQEMSAQQLVRTTDKPFTPKVRVLLELSSDRLGVQVLFDGTIQEPALFHGNEKQSARALDTMLLHTVDEAGIWDELQRCWYVNSSDGIATVLGLLQEFSDVRSFETNQHITLSSSPLDARMTVAWQAQGAELSMDWVLPDGKIAEREHDLFGNGPYWTLVATTLYRLSINAAKIARLFPLGPRFSLGKTQLGPILEALQDGLHSNDFLVLENEKLQPATEVCTPTPVLHMERRDGSFEHFSQGQLELGAVLEFEYPSAPTGKNLVFLPDRARERECHEKLIAAGFEFHADKKRYIASGNPALDLLSTSKDLFKDWTVHGLDIIQRGVRFVDSTITVSLANSQNADGPTETKSRKKTESLKGIDWFDCHVSLVLNNANVPLSALFKGSVSDETRWVRLDSGAFTRVPGGSIGQLKSMLGMLDPNFKLSNSIKTRLRTPLALGLTRLSDRQFNVTMDKSLRVLADKLDDFRGIDNLPVSKGFEGSLRPYQQDGVNWLSFLHEFDLGGVLADEMGLGKTVQTLAFLQTLKDKLTSKKAKGGESWKPVLVVAPTSVIMNWWYEAKRFTPRLKTLLLHGAKRKKDLAHLADHDIVITSYALLRVDRYELERFEFGYLILDEAQHIKNFQAATTIAAKNMRARHRVALSGTPTENRPLELWSIMDFLMPGYLGGHEFFRTHIEKPILELGGAAEVASFLRNKTRPFILRRTKSEVEKDLPPKIETTLHVEMAPSQRQLYQHILDEVRPRVMDAIEKKGVAGASVSILAALLRLRQVCNHPNSIESLKEVPGYDSGKFGLLKELLEEALQSGRKLLIFAQFREMLAIMRRHLEETGVRYEYLDGATRDRQSVIDRFNQDESVRVFLISLKAGGQGLNLTAADTVIIYDPWWNPAVESQAVDRAHRIGQKKVVHVYRLVTEESVEQKIMDLKRRKTAIIDVLVNEQGLSPTALTKTDLEQLFMPLSAEDGAAA